jgi:hypothetical protein
VGGVVEISRQREWETANRDSGGVEVGRHLERKEKAERVLAQRSVKRLGSSGRILLETGEAGL